MSTRPRGSRTVTCPLALTIIADRPPPLWYFHRSRSGAAQNIGDRWWTGIGLSADPAVATTITVDAVGPRVVIDTQIEAAATITGALANPDATPVADRLVVVRTTTDGLVAAATTGPDGTFVLRISVTGDYRLALYDPETGTFEPIGEPTYTLVQDQVLDLGTLTVGVPATGATAIAAGNVHTCAAHSDGTVSCWGYNIYGQLGNGTTSESATQTPVTVTGISDAVSISAGRLHTCAVRAPGTVACWGYICTGQLGNTATTSFPVAVVGFP